MRPAPIAQDVRQRIIQLRVRGKKSCKAIEEITGYSARTIKSVLELHKRKKLRKVRREQEIKTVDPYVCLRCSQRHGQRIMTTLVPCQRCVAENYKLVVSGRAL